MIEFEKNIPLVHYVFKRYFGTAKRYKEDLIQCGMLGLWKAYQNFNAEKDIKFNTFACICISNEMGMFMRKERRQIVPIENINEDGECILDIITDTSQNIEKQIELEDLLERYKTIKEYCVKDRRMKDIAKENNVTVQAISKRLKKEKKIFKEMLDEGRRNCI